MQVTQQSAETNAAARAVQDGKEDILVLWLACRQYVMQQARRWYRAFEGGAASPPRIWSRQAFALAKPLRREAGKQRVFHMAYISPEISVCSSLSGAHES